MRTYKITFSPTGGTKRVADLVAGVFTKDCIHIDLTDRELDFKALHFSTEDICIVAVPVYGGRAPEIAISRLKQMTGGCAKTVLIAVYGNRDYEDTLLELQDTLTGAGFCCVAGIAAIAEHSIMHQFAAGRPDAADQQKLAAFAEEIRAKLERGERSDKLAAPGNRPYRAFGGLPMKPKAGRACTQCGLCAPKCPVGAIPIDDPSKVDAGMCITCMRCIAVCPGHARSVSKLLTAVAGAKMKKVCADRKENELFI